METSQAQYTILLDSLKLLAKSYDDQLTSFPGFVSVPDKLANAFDDAYLLLPQLVEKNMIPQSLIPWLDQINEILENMNENMWDLSALKDAPGWEQCRRLARQVLNSKELYR